MRSFETIKTDIQTIIYTVQDIDEDIDFGCEERADDEPVMAIAVLLDPNGQTIRVRTEDALLYARDINAGDKVHMMQNPSTGRIELLKAEKTDL